MKKGIVVASALTAALLVAAGGVSAFAADTEAYSYRTGQDAAVARNALYAQAEELPEEERDAFLAERGVGETPWSEEAAASYSYVAGQRRGASYRQEDAGEDDQDTSGYSYRIGAQRGGSYQP